MAGQPQATEVASYFAPQNNARDKFCFTKLRDFAERNTTLPSIALTRRVSSRYLTFVGWKNIRRPSIFFYLHQLT